MNSFRESEFIRTYWLRALGPLSTAILQVDWCLCTCSTRLGAPCLSLGVTSLLWCRCVLWDEQIIIRVTQLKYFLHSHKTKNPNGITGIWLYSVIPHPKRCQKTIVLTWKLWPLGIFPSCQMPPWPTESYFYPAMYDMICGCSAFHRHLGSNGVYLQMHLWLCSHICAGIRDFVR